MTTILLIRHGETAWNREKVFRGTHDIPLNDTGRAQAKLLAGALAGREIHAAYTSPLSRARETAELALTNRGVQPVVCDGLLDFNYGQWTTLSEAEVAKRWPQQYELWRSLPERAVPPGGDTLQAVYDRAFATMERIAADHDGRTVAMFAHRVVNKLLVLAAMRQGPERFNYVRQDNCCINEFQRVEGGYVIVTVNDTSHVRGSADLLTADF